ncbi:MAG: YveK family protein [Acetivibrionales bacterium]|jgi:capsular polysaccharide biosynthesis protein
MDVRQIVRLFLRRWWVFALFAAIIGSIACYMNYFVMVPVYQATATVLLNDKNRHTPEYGIAYDQVVVNQLLIAEYTEIIYSRSIGQAIIDDLKLEGIKPEYITGMISVGTKNETRVMELSAISPDPELAMKVANSLAKVFAAKAEELMNIPHVNIIDAAELPEYPVAPRKARNTVISVFAAIVLAAGVILTVEYLDNTIKTAEDAENRLKLTVLATIPELKMK